ncbi:aromatic amino acid ammonia-lyase [Amycolatopsis rhabdoformis]|uniref:Aromatic amino acid ammonia-lyase n=1 Tax=Amycolatopsis rhabdoformis TaxID=1448059 RepID=A0ABZ1I7B6_9PSEU|nr:aromatic amino acid ammonia-lyase [Amycolatopsis rhabdoformis]WSE29856.1 aromatic amino acid ammonia-lyase [Amycolatopsis rhabdoformis]
MTDTSRIEISGSGLRCADVVRVARRSAWTELAPEAVTGAERSYELAVELGAKRAVYGRTTGVGANRHTVVDPESADHHGLRLLRSHAGGTGEPLADEVVRAVMAIRLNQLAAGGSGVHPRLLRALETALRVGALPLVHSRGAIGTGDLTALAEVALTLAGELPWAAGDLDPLSISPGDALAFISSNAATLAEAVLAWHDLRRLLSASHVVTALTFCALGGSAEAYSQRVHAARPHPGAVYCAAELRRLLLEGDEVLDGRRLQDPFGLRAFPQVQGPALDAAASVERVLDIDINAAAENPLIDVETEQAYHHGQFSTAHVALAFDHLRAALHHVAELSTARLGDLVEPDLSGLPPFLAQGPAGSSGIMILEYVAHDALGTLRHASSPVTLGTAVISRGLEDHASFSTHAVRSTVTATAAYRTVLACELLGAVRALRLSGVALPNTPLREAFRLAEGALPYIAEDHPLSAEISLAERLLDRLAVL